MNDSTAVKYYNVYTEQVRTSYYFNTFVSFNLSVSETFPGVYHILTL